MDELALAFGPLAASAEMRAPTGPVGVNRVGVFGIVSMSLLVVLATIVLLYTLVVFWPAPSNAGASGGGAGGGVNYFGYAVNVSGEGQLFIVVIVAGALGGMLHTLRSLSWYIGNRDLRRSWILMYALLPLVGAVLGTIFYVVLRGGLLTAQTSTQDVNAYGFAAVSALVGLFSEQAVLKLRDVFAALFVPSVTGTDHVSPKGPGTPTVSSVVPNSGRPGTAMIITGTNLADITAVEFGAVSGQVTQASDTQLTVVVPQGATSGELTLVSGNTRTPTGIQFAVIA